MILTFYRNYDGPGDRWVQRSLPIANFANRSAAVEAPRGDHSNRCLVLNHRLKYPSQYYLFKPSFARVNSAKYIGGDQFLLLAASLISFSAAA